MFSEVPLFLKDAFPRDIYARDRNDIRSVFQASKRPCYRSDYGNKYTHKYNDKLRTRPSQKKKKDAAINYTIESIGDSKYEMKLYKQIPSGMLHAAINKKAKELVDKLYVPSYHVVEDFFGRQYYVEDEVDPVQLRQKVLSSINVNEIKRKIARELFQDYGVELNHRGDEVCINSEKDSINQEFSFEKELADIRVKSCKAVSDETVMLCIELLVNQPEDVKQSTVPRTVDINFALLPSKTGYLIASNTEEASSSDDENSSKEKETGDHLDVLYADRLALDKCSKEEDEVNYNSSEESSIASDSESDTEDEKTHVAKVYSPILENVEDEEVNRYRKSFDHSPTGYALIEDP